MRGLGMLLLAFGSMFVQPGASWADGINSRLSDAVVVPPVSNALGGSALFGAQGILPGSNEVGRPGYEPDQIHGYDVNIAYDHVAVGAMIVSVMFLATAWMGR